MAEIGLAVAQTLFAALQCSELKEICSIWGYKSQLEDLNQTVTTIKNVLLDASRMELSHELRGYVEELKDVVYEADDLFDEFVTRLELKQLKGSMSKHDRFSKRFLKKVRRFFSPDESEFSQAYRMFHKVKEIRKKLSAIVDNHKKFALNFDYKPICLRREETCSWVDVKDIIGRDDDRKAVIGKLLESKDQGVRFLTLVGVGGLGKTALAQLVYNDEDIQREFGDLRFWVCVSDQDKQQFDVKAILTKILKLVTQGVRSFDAFELELLHQEFRKELGGKKYLLVLDDVWNEDSVKWDDLRKFLMRGQGGSRVLVTTRSEKTAAIIRDGQHTYRLQGLSPEDSWDLFKMWAFSQGNPLQKEWVEIGENIVPKCFNNPLAIRVVGSLLCGRDISQWRSFEDIGLAEFSKDDDNKIMSVLKLSYHNLETSLKSCFTYCAVFPKDYRIEKEMLLNLWIAQGYCKDDAAEDHFLVLLQRCFFQDVEKDEYGDVDSVKLHDLMHDLAQEVAGKEIQILSSSVNGNIGDEVCHLSFVGINSPQSSSTRNKVRSFIALDDFVNPQIVFKNFIFLRVLVLIKLEGIKQLEPIGELLHLRYLDLSKDYFEALPSSITKLHNLQTLNLRWWKGLSELPDDLNKLTNLRHLDIRGCTNLTCMPSGMDKLTRLKVLTYFVVGWRDHPIEKQRDDEFKGLETLTNLTGGISISIGRNYRNVEHPKSGSYLSQMKHLKKVSIQFGRKCVNPEAILEKLEPHRNLKVLRLESYDGQTIPWWRREAENKALNLVSITIKKCMELQTMPSLSKLPYLKSLEVEGLDKLEYMEETGSCGEAKEAPFFPSLESLKLNQLEKLKGWFRFSRKGLVGEDNFLSRRFPRLSNLKIIFCNNLVTFPPCPSVKTLWCQKLGIVKQVVDEGNGGTSCLTTLTIEYDRELKSLAEMSNVFLSCASSLRSLTIKGCDNVASISEGLEHLNALEEMTVFLNHQLNFSEHDIMHPWKSLRHSLRTLQLIAIMNMTSLPKGMIHLNSLQTLTIRSCPKLNALPEWIHCLSSLQYLHILTDDRLFEEKCSEPGEEWQKIKHIPHIAIN